MNTEQVVGIFFLKYILPYTVNGRWMDDWKVNWKYKHYKSVCECFSQHIDHWECFPMEATVIHSQSTFFLLYINTLSDHWCNRAKFGVQYPSEIHFEMRTLRANPDQWKTLSTSCATPRWPWMSWTPFAALRFGYCTVSHFHDYGTFLARFIYSFIFETVKEYIEF